MAEQNTQPVDDLEQRALEFRNRPDIWQRLWENADPNSGRSREQNTAWLMAAFARSLLAAERKRVLDEAGAACVDGWSNPLQQEAGRVCQERIRKLMEDSHE